MADINILMMGGRRCGKTSVLASMEKCFTDIAADIDGLGIDCIDSGNEILFKIQELKGYFSPVYKRKKVFTADLNPSTASHDYEYSVKLNGKNSGYDMKFIDFPGENLDKDEKAEELQKMVDDSQVIIVAIDTPHLVEEIDEATGVGKHHYKFNRVDKITRFFKRTFQNTTEDRLIIFVPLKCEKYYYRNKLKKVSDLVKLGYSELFDFLGSGGVEDKCTVLITPILTLGGSEFYKFVEEEDKFFPGETVMVSKYCHVGNPADAKYSPKFCEQPLILVLHYLIGVARKNAEGRNRFSRWFKEKFTNAAKLSDLMACEQHIRSLAISDPELGYIAVQEPINKK